MLGEQRSVHIGHTVPRLLFIKCLNPPLQQDTTRVQIQRDRGLPSSLVPAKERRDATPALFFTDSSVFHT